MEESVENNVALIAAVIANDAASVQALLERGAEANCHEDPAQLRPLHFAALYDSPQVVPLLVMAGADVAAMTDCEDTPLSIAKRHGHELVVAALGKHLTGGGGGINRH